MVSPSPTSETAKLEPPGPAPLKPDRELLRRLLGSGGEALRQCVQCATCSAVCGLSADDKPFPRKEMLWAQWGLKDRLMADADLWLCHECHDCTLRCPRGARPGDVMAALRRECVTHYGVPGLLSRCASRPAGLAFFVVVASALLYAGSVFWKSSGMAASEFVAGGERIVIPFWTELPHGLLISLFSAVLAFDAVVLGVGLARFWRALRKNAAPGRDMATKPVTGWGSSIRAALSRTIWHDDFAECTNEAKRQTNHTLVVYGMVGLILVDFWILAARYNPMKTGLVYPLSLLDPWKVMANLAGLALIVGCTAMILERIRRPERSFPATRSAELPDSAVQRSGTYSDWLLLALLVTAALTGFVTESLHLLRLDGARHAAYAVHLVSVLTFFLVLPYSKLAHLGYRTVALVFAERLGTRRRTAQPAAPEQKPLPILQIAQSHQKPQSAPGSALAFPPVPPREKP